MKNNEFKKWTKNLLLVLAGVVGYVIIVNYAMIGAWFSRLFKYLSPFFAGAIIAYILDIPTRIFEKSISKSKNKFIKKYAGSLSVICTLLIVLLLATVSIWLLIPQIKHSISNFVQNFPYYYENAINYINNFEYLGAEDAIKSFLNSLLESISQPDLLGFSFIWSSLRKVLTVSTYMLNAFITVTTAIYLMFDSKNIASFFGKIFYAFVPEKYSKVLSKYLKDANDYFKTFLYCNTVDGVIIGIVSTIGLAIIGAPYAVILGIVEGVTNMIPYFGAIIGSILVSIIVLITSGLNKALIVGLFLFILQMIDGHIIKPKLYGGSFNISPFLVILGITLGGIYWGIIGMIIAIPIIAIIRNIINDILEYRIKLKKEESKA